MRTTINLDPALIERAKTIAVQSGTSFTQVIEDAVRESMARRDRAPDRQSIPLPVHRGGNLLPGVDLDDSAALLDIMEGRGPVILADVNVLVYAHRDHMPDHERYRAWLEATIDAAEPYAVSELVLSGFLRIVTHPTIFDPPDRTDEALEFVASIRDRANAVIVRPGLRHWDIFVDLLERTGANGNLVPDAYLAALAIETGSEFITTDLDFSRFPGLRWRHPLRAA